MSDQLEAFTFSALIALGVAIVLKLSFRSTLRSLWLTRSEIAKILIAAAILAAVLFFALPRVR
jgi:hypothetical protein